MLISQRVQRLTAAVGRRGLALLIFGILDIGISYGIFTVADYSPTVRLGYIGQAAILPLRVWAWVWLLVAVVCILQAFSRHDRAAFVLGATIKMSWGAGFLVAFAVYDMQRAWLSSLIYFAISGLLLMISGWEENHPTVVMVGEK